MTTMLDRMAMALFEREASRRGWPGGWEGNTARHGRFRDDARATLLAIREPDTALFANPDACFVGFVQRGEEPEENVYLEPDEAAAAFKSAIDAILNEKPEGGA